MRLLGDALGHDFLGGLVKLAALGFFQVVGDAGAHDDIGRLLGLKRRFGGLGYQGGGGHERLLGGSLGGLGLGCGRFFGGASCGGLGNLSGRERFHAGGVLLLVGSVRGQLDGDDVLAERVSVQSLAYAGYPRAFFRINAAGGIEAHAHDEAAALQLDFQPREHKLRLALLALTAVEDLHLVVHGVHLVQQPVLNVVAPQRVGAFHGGIQIFAGSHAHRHAEGVDGLVVLALVGAHHGRSQIRVAAIDLQSQLVIDDRLVQIKREGHGRMGLAHRCLLSSYPLRHPV